MKRQLAELAVREAFEVLHFLVEGDRISERQMKRSSLYLKAALRVLGMKP